MFLIDYLVITKKLGELAPEQIFFDCSLPLNSFVPCKPRYGYTYGLKFQDICVYYGGTFCFDTICVCLSGKGCRQYESRLKKPLEEQLIYLVNMGYRIRRIDRCIDIEFDMISYVRDNIKSGNVCTHCRKYDDIVNYDNKLGENGRTFYIGSRKSEQFIRVYDKGAELGGQPCKLYRIEVVQRGSKCTLDEDAFCRSVNSYFRVIDKTEENLSRCASSEIWSDIFGIDRKKKVVYNVSGNDLKVCGRESYILKIRKYVTREILKYGISNYFKSCAANSRLYAYYSITDSKFLPRDFRYV